MRFCVTEKVWFAVVGSERKGPFSEEQIAGLLSAGAMTAHSNVWSKLSANETWTPLYRSELKHLLGDAEIAPPPLPGENPAVAKAARPSISSSGNLELTDWGQDQTDQVGFAGAGTANFAAASKASSTTFAPTLVPYRIALFGTWLLGVFNFVLLKQLLRGPEDLDSKFARYHGTPDTEQALGLFALFTLTVFAIGLFWWLRSSTLNLQTLDGPQSITPAGAIYWYFVPVANLWKPYEAMRNLIDGFVIEKRDRIRLLCIAWWLLMLASLALEIVADLLLSKAEVERSDAELGLFLFQSSIFTGIAACFALYVIVSAVQAGSTKRVLQAA